MRTGPTRSTNNLDRLSCRSKVPFFTLHRLEKAPEPSVVAARHNLSRHENKRLPLSIMPPTLSSQWDTLCWCWIPHHARSAHVAHTRYLKVRITRCQIELDDICHISLNGGGLRNSRRGHSGNLLNRKTHTSRTATLLWCSSRRQNLTVTANSSSSSETCDNAN